MKEKSEHGQPLHLNYYTLDHNSDITAYGTHDRVLVFGAGQEVLVRVDTHWNLGEPSEKQIRKVARLYGFPIGKRVMLKKTFKPKGCLTPGYFLEYGFR